MAIMELAVAATEVVKLVAIAMAMARTMAWRLQIASRLSSLTRLLMYLRHLLLVRQCLAIGLSSAAQNVDPAEPSGDPSIPSDGAELLTAEQETPVSEVAETSSFDTAAARTVRRQLAT